MKGRDKSTTRSRGYKMPKLSCPECGEDMSFTGYRPLFPECTGCGKNFHVNDCVKED